MDSRALQAGVGASLTAADYRGMTADQVRQTQQAGMQQFGMMAQVIDAMKGRQLQREQMDQMERHYQHQRDMAQKQFELMQRQEVRENITQAFNMFATKASHQLETQRLKLEEQVKTQQMTLTDLQINQIQQEMKQAEATQEMMTRLNDIPIPIAGGTVPLGVVAVNDNLSRIYMEQLKTVAQRSSDHPTSVKEAEFWAQQIMHNSGGKVPQEAAMIEAYMLTKMKDIPSLPEFASMVSDSYRLKNLFRTPEDIRSFWEATSKFSNDLMASMVAGDGPYARKYSRRYADTDSGLIDDPVTQMQDMVDLLQQTYPEATLEEIYEVIHETTGVHPREILDADRGGTVSPGGGPSIRQPIVR